MERRPFLKKAGIAVIAATFPRIFAPKITGDLPRVLILGDSISIGYTPFVKEMLKGKAGVSRPMLDSGNAENCAGTTKGRTEIKRWVGEEKWDVIHFNFGLHDIKHIDPVTGANSKDPDHPHQAGLKQYKKNLSFIVSILKTTGASLIYATTTPYPHDVDGPLRKPGMPEKYNKVATRIMKKNHIPVNDLYAFVLPRMAELQRPKNVHFSEAGSKALAEQVAAVIRKYL